MHNPNGESIDSAVFAQLTAESPYTVNGRPFHQNCPFPRGIWIPILHMIPWAHPSPQPKRHLDLISRFCRAH